MEVCSQCRVTDRSVVCRVTDLSFTCLVTDRSFTCLVLSRDVVWLTSVSHVLCCRAMSRDRILISWARWVEYCWISHNGSARRAVPWLVWDVVRMKKGKDWFVSALKWENVWMNEYCVRCVCNIVCHVTMHCRVTERIVWTHCRVTCDHESRDCMQWCVTERIVLC